MGNRQWTELEIKQLKESLNNGKSATNVAKMLGRSEKAVRIKANRLGIEICKYHFDLLSIFALSQIMEIEWKTVHRWTKIGLKVTKKGNIYLLKHNDIIRFLKAHPDEWDATRGNMYIVNQEPWFQAKYESDMAKKKEARNVLKNWNEYDARELVRLRDKGWDYKDLAMKYGRTKRACIIKVCEERKKQREKVGRI